MLAQVNYGRYQTQNWLEDRQMGGRSLPLTTIYTIESIDVTGRTLLYVYCLCVARWRDEAVNCVTIFKLLIPQIAQLKIFAGFSRNELIFHILNGNIKKKLCWHNIYCTENSWQALATIFVQKYSALCDCTWAVHTYKNFWLCRIGQRPHISLFILINLKNGLMNEHSNNIIHLSQISIKCIKYNIFSENIKWCFLNILVWF